MTFMLCRNRVKDFKKWKAIFDSHCEAHKDEGMKLVKMWRAVDDPNNVFFLFDLESVEKAKAFISAPEAAEAGEESGVIDGEIHFVEEA